MLSPASGCVRQQSGFTLVELMVTIALVSILLMLSLPSFTTMMRNSQVRSAADALQNGLRTAQNLAIQKNRAIVLSFTNQVPRTSSTAVANGSNWAIHAIPRTQGDDLTADERYLMGGLLSETAGVVINTHTENAVCFSANGRLISPSSTGVTGASCAAVDASAMKRYDISMPGSDRALRVELNFNGRVRMCDPARVFSADAPDGCTPENA
jgi:type IV fimbrial biogenesis protein FimT